MPTREEYLRIPLLNAEELIIKQGGKINESTYKSLNDLKNDVKTHYYLNHYQSDINNSGSDIERLYLIEEKKTLMMSEIDRKFKALIDKYGLDF